MLVTVARDEAVEDDENPRSNLAQVLYIRYPINFGTKSVSILLDSSNKVNAVCPTFAKELGLSIRPLDVGAQKIHSTILNTYKMVVIVFLVKDKTN